eukprot:5300963-Amphidinium_carterae.1
MLEHMCCCGAMAAKVAGMDNALLNTSAREDVEELAVTENGKASPPVPVKKEDPRLCGIELKWWSLVSLTLQTTWQ